MVNSLDIIYIAGALLALKVFYDFSLDKSIMTSSVTPHANKPYGSFGSFYPHYISEHSNDTNRLLHTIGTTITIIWCLVKQPRVAASFIVALGAGSIAFQVFREMSHGAAEALVVLSTSAIVFSIIKPKGASMKNIAVPLLIGYGFAWVGHSQFEGNKPATFIYPTYSLFGDFVMLTESYKELYKSIESKIEL